MSDVTIPEDVMMKAMDVASAAGAGLAIGAAETIARAILAERERAAKIVEAHTLQFVLETIPERASDRVEYVFVPGAQTAIAQAIRSSHE